MAATNLIPGPMAAIAGTMIPGPPGIYPAMWSDTKTSTTMATGATIRTMAMSGTPITLRRDGRPITRAIGLGLLPGDTRGSMTRTGATHPSTMDAG